MPPTTTMKRIAGELGVSITTVSKVLNNREDIGDETRARVLAKVEELGYQPNAVARSLTLRRTHTLGVVIPDLMHSFFVEIVAGLESVASRRGYGILLCSSSEDPQKERQELEMLRQRQVDGVILGSANASGNTDLLQRLTTLGMGLVMIDRDDHPDVRCDRVLTDDEEVGRLATAHLIAQGRRTIGHITGNTFAGLAGIEIERSPHRKGTGPFPPVGEPVGVRHQILGMLRGLDAVAGLAKNRRHLGAGVGRRYGHDRHSRLEGDALAHTHRRTAANHHVTVGPDPLRVLLRLPQHLDGHVLRDDAGVDSGRESAQPLVRVLCKSRFGRHGYHHGTSAADAFDLVG